MRSRPFGLVPLAVSVSLVLAVSCSDDIGPQTTTDSGAATSEPTTSARPDTRGAFGWEPFGSDDAGPGDVEIGTLEVPVDYDDPAKGTFELFIARRLADDPDRRIGSLLVNPGGPGFGGSDLVVSAEQIYGPELLERFDIVGWDPRGTGLTTPAIDCIDDYDRYFASTDITPDTDAERQQIVDLAEEFQTQCAERNADIIEHIGTNSSARDMDTIRQALQEETISYFGFSYGSELGAAWATLFPDTVRAAVLDGAADPTADYITDGLQQSVGFEASLSTFLARCSADSDCAFHSDGDAERAFDALMLALDEQPIPSVADRPDVTRGMALTAVQRALYGDFLWPELEQALADARDGNGEGLLGLYDSYYQRLPDGTYDNSLEAFQSIYCMDTTTRLSIEEEDAQTAQFNEAAPRLSPRTTGDYFCTFYPPSADPRISITGSGAGPILVIGTTGDPSTPLASTEKMAAALEQGVLVVVEAEQHTGYGVNDCAYDVVHAYLIDLELPDDGTRCT
jgi:pimeloyl-ACP methyl ester carboxylesterase